MTRSDLERHLGAEDYRKAGEGSSTAGGRACGHLVSCAVAWAAVKDLTQICIPCYKLGHVSAPYRAEGPRTASD
jgi:hypothetical protein